MSSWRFSEGDPEEKPMSSTAAAIGCFAALVVVCIMLFVVARGAADTWSQWQQDACQRRWPEKEVHWEFWNGCTLLTQEGWIPEKNYRVLD